jgi:acetolactate synthase I/II/III large subunit
VIDTASKTVAEAVVEVLAREQVPFVAGLPGSGVMEYLDVVQRTGAPRFVLVRHEQVAVHMALGYAELSGRPAAVLVSRSPGASNTVIGVQAAYVEGSPLVLISSQVSSRVRGLGAFQEVDLEDVFAPITKWSTTASSPERVTEVVEEAFRVAVSGRPGPVHVSIPLDFPAERIEPRFSVPSRHLLGRSEPPADGVREAASLLAASRRPVIVAGGGVTRSRAAEAVLELADLLGAAVTNTWEKKAVREDHPLTVGNIGRGGTSASAAVLHEADVVLALGVRFSEAATDDYRMRLGADQRLIQVDVDAACVGRVFPVSVGLAADAKATVARLIGELGDGQPDARAPWRTRIAALRDSWEAQLADVDWEATPIRSPRVVRDLRRAMAPDAVLTVDSGNFNYWVQRYFAATASGTYIYPAGTGTMGAGLPAAMGIKVACPDRQVVAVAGDGGFAMTMQDLETCVRERIGVTVVVMNNFAYGNIKIRQQTKFANRLIGCEFGNPDFAALARLFGAGGERVAAPEQLGPALERALHTDGPSVLDVHVDPDEICTATVEQWW